jgi:hypothetical protein
MGSASSRSSGISHAPARQARLTFLGTTTPDTSRTDLSVSPTNAGFPAFSLFILIHNTTLVKDTLGSQHEAIHGATPPSPPDTWVATLVELPRLLRCKCPRHSPNFPRNDMGLNGGDPRDPARTGKTLREHGPGSAVPFPAMLAIVSRGA